MWSFKQFEIVTADGKCHRVKFHANGSKVQIFLHVPFCIIVPHFVTIGRAIADI